MILRIIAACALAYLIGSVSCGVLVGYAFGQGDVRKKGSGNAGTTNVLRTLGWVPSVVTLAGDAVKGWLATWLGGLIAGIPGMLAAGFCVLVGHIWPLFFRFKGGKGIGPALGMIFAISPWLAIGLLLAELVIVGSTGYMSIASIANTVLYPTFTAVLFWKHEYAALYILFAAMSGLLVLFAHRANVLRLIRRQENRLDFKKIKLGTKKKG